MVSFLFWNVNRNPVQEIVAELAELYEIDVIILAESNIEESNMVFELNSRTDSRYSTPPRRGRRIDIYTRFPSNWFTSVADPYGMSIQHLEDPILNSKLLVVAVHLPSRLHQSDEDLSQLATRWREDIEDAEKDVGHSNTVVVGDLNMDPFHRGVVSSEGLHGVMDKRIAARKTRRVLEKERHFFYNPMWALFGNEQVGPPGTFFYDASSRPVNYFWHMYDQVLLRPELLPFFNDSDLRILTHTETYSLLTDSGRPDADNTSDHFPLLFRIELPVIRDDLHLQDDISVSLDDQGQG